MKKFLLGLALISLMAACSTDTYKISGSFDDISEGTVFLKKIVANGLEDVDTAIIKNGAYVFEGSVEYPELHLIYIENVSVPIPFFLENSKISITASTENMEDAVIKGSKLSTLFETFNKEVPHSEKVEKMQEEFIAAQSQGDQATMESIMSDMDVIVEDQQTYYRNFVKENTDNVVGAFVTLNLAQSLELEELEEIAAKLELSLSTHPYVIQLNEMLAPIKAQKEAEAALNIGQVAPLFTLTNMEGNEVSLDEFRGKYVFIDFWAAWCRPCREENPILKNAYDRFGGEDFEIISVSLDQTVEAWHTAVAEDGLNWTLLHDSTGAVAQTYAVQTIPNTWLLDKEGKIIHKQLRGEEVISVLEELLQ
jgi:peroxiredoxin